MLTCYNVNIILNLFEFISYLGVLHLIENTCCVTSIGLS